MKLSASTWGIIAGALLTLAIVIVLLALDKTTLHIYSEKQGGETPKPVAPSSDSVDPRCQSAIQVQAQARVALAQVPRIGIDAANARRQLEAEIEQAEREIDLYC